MAAAATATSIRHLTTTIVAQSQPVAGQITQNALRSNVQELVPHKYEMVRPVDLGVPGPAGQLLSRVLDRIQRNADDATRSARSLPVLGGVYLPDLTLNPGSHTIAHGIQGGGDVSWLPVRLRPSVTPGTRYAVQTTASAAVVVKVTTTAKTPIATGWTVSLQGILGTTEANGIWSVTVVDDTHFTLDGSTYANSYVSGGIVRVPAPEIVESSQDTTNGRITLLVVGQPMTLDLWLFPTPAKPPT